MHSPSHTLSFLATLLSPFLFFSFFPSRSSCVEGSNTGDKELVKSAISIRMTAYSCREPTLVNVRIEGLGQAKKQLFSQSKVFLGAEVALLDLGRRVWPRLNEQLLIQF